MAGGGETKRKAGIHLDFDKLLAYDDAPPPQLVILGASEKSKPWAEMVPDGEDGNFPRNLSDKELVDGITRARRFLKTDTLPDGGQKLRARLSKLEAEMERRSLHKDDNKCKTVKILADQSTCNGVTNDLSHPGAPPSKPVSDFSLQFCRKLDGPRAKECFREDLCTLKRSDLKPIPAQIKHKKGLSSRQAPFKSPSHISVNIDDQQRTNGEQRGIHASNTSPHPSDKDASCCLTKKGSGARRQLPLNSRRNNRKTLVLVDEELEELEELEVGVVNNADQVGQSSKKTRIYYPSRDDPVAIEICYSDMECLAPESYLTSPIMNFYIRYLQKSTSLSARRKHDYHIFNTYFYEKLKQDVLTKADKEASFFKFRRWWKGVNIFEKAYIFLPIHETVHWSLVIICMPNKEDESGPIILHLDSLGLHTSESIFRNVKSFLIEEWRFLRQQEVLPEPPIAENIWNMLSRRIDEKVIEVPQQRNDYDCGLFVLFFMERFIDEAPERLRKQDLERFGRRWFRPEEASNLREKIRNLLREEFKNASEDTCEVDS